MTQNGLNSISLIFHQDLRLRGLRHERLHLRELAFALPRGAQGRRDVLAGHQGVEAGPQPGQIRIAPGKIRLDQKG